MELRRDAAAAARESAGRSCEGGVSRAQASSRQPLDLGMKLGFSSGLLYDKRILGWAFKILCSSKWTSCGPKLKIHLPTAGWMLYYLSTD